MTIGTKVKRNAKVIENVLVDLGLDDAEELTVNAMLAVKFNALVEKRELSQTEVSAITGMAPSKISQVRRYKLRNIPITRLMQALASLDQHVDIVVRPARRSDHSGISVVT